MKTLTLLFSILLFTLSGFSQNFEGDKKEIKKILKAVEEFSSYVMTSDHVQLGKCYTEDGKIFPSGDDIIHGIEGITEYWVMPEEYSITHHKVTPSEIKIIGDEAYDYGYYEGISQGPNGIPTSWGGKYVIVWKKVDGEWKIYLDIWNSIELTETISE